MLQVFDDGDFSEDSTFLVNNAIFKTIVWKLTITQLTDWLAHVPKDVIAKNFQTTISAFDHIPANELYIFPSCKDLTISISLIPSQLPFDCNQPLLRMMLKHRKAPKEPALSLIPSCYPKLHQLNCLGDPSRL